MFDLSKFKSGYIILYKNAGGIFGNGIVKKQRLAGFSEENAQYCHAEIVGAILEKRGIAYSINVAPPISKRIEILKKHKGRYIRVMRWKNDDYEKQGRYDVSYLSATICNTGYDVRNILGFIFKWLRHKNRLWFCSEGCCWALQLVYPNALGGMKKEACMPAHFTNQAEFETVFEGYIPK